MTADIEAAHKASIYHRADVERSESCACFHCLAVFEPKDVEDWTDLSRPRDQWTALCPACGIDAVLPGAAGYPLTAHFLKDMQSRWFAGENED